MTASTRSPPASVRSRLRQARAPRIRSNLSRSASGIVTRSASTPRRRSSSVGRRTCRSAPPSTNGVWTPRTRTRRLNGSLRGGSRRGLCRGPLGAAGVARGDPADQRVVLGGEEQVVELSLIVGRRVQTVRVRQGGAVLDAQVREAGGLGQESESFRGH